MFDRLKRAARAFMRPDSGEALISAATVRPYELSTINQRYRRREAAELVGRFVGVVKVAASRNAMAVASLPLRVYKTKTGAGKTAWEHSLCRRKSFASAGAYARKHADTGDDLVEITDESHPLVALLDQANSRDNGFSLIEDTALWLSMAGDAYWYMADAEKGEPGALWPLAPQFVHVIPDRENFIEAYVYGRGYEVERTFPAEVICHFRNPNPLGNPYHGRGDLEACIEEADLGRSFVQFALATVNNGAQPGLVFSSEQWVTQDQIEAARLRYEEMYQGRWKAGRSLFLNGKVTVEPWSFTEKEMAFLASSERVDQVIANVFDMPVSILRLDTAALATAKAAIPQWQLMAIRPRARRIEDQINQRIVKPYWPGYFVCFDEAVDRDLEAAAVRVASLYQNDIMTKNEARREIDLDEVPDGDQFNSEAQAQRQQDQMESQAALGMGGGSRGSGGDANSVDEPKLNSGKSGLKIVGALALSASSMLWTPHAEACCHNPPRNVQKDRTVIAANEHTLEAALRAFFRGQTPTIVNSIDDQGGLGVDLGPGSDFAQSFSEHVNRILRALYDAGTRAGVMDLSGRASDPAALTAALTGGATDFLEKFGGRLITSVSTTLRDRILAQLSEGVEAGENMDQLTARVREVMDGAATYGAERIARTETSRAFNSARQEAWQESGIVAGKRWLLSADPCPICQTLAALANAKTGIPLADAFVRLGETIALAGGGEFKADYAAVDVPPAHPNCRCSTEAVFNL